MFVLKNWRKGSVFKLLVDFLYEFKRLSEYILPKYYTLAR